MRRWNRERGKRRKSGQPAEAEAKGKVQTPLQPKFYDNEAESAPSEEPKPRVPEPAAEPEAEAAEAAGSAQSAESPAKAARPTRRRRGRGGRGKARKPETAPAAAPEGAEETEAAPEPESAAAQAEVRPETVPQTSVPSVPQGTRPSKGTVILSIGLPGSGKSSWFKRHNIRPLSSDLLRELLFDDVQEQRFQDLIFSNLRSMLKARLIARRPLNYVDATNLTPHDRHSWIKLAKDFGYEVQAVFFDVPLEICSERNQRRSRVVSDEVMQKMAGKLRPPTFEEGFTKITVVRVKKKDNLEPVPLPLAQ